MSDLLSSIDRLIDNKKLELDGHTIAETIFRYVPVSFKEFVESKKYCGFITLTKRQLDACYAMLYNCTYDEYESMAEKPIDIFSKPIYNTACLMWGKGAGKDAICTLITFYVSYYLLCCKNPQKLLGLPDNEAIDIVNVAYSGEQAKNVFFEKLKQRIIHNAWIRKHFNVVLSGANMSEKTLELTSEDIIVGANAIIFPNLIRLFSRHSEQESTEGLNLLMFTMDEADAFKDKTQSRNADKIYNMLQTSAESRFGNKYKGFLISYPRTDRGFMTRMIKMAEKDLHIYADTAFTWEVREDKYKNSPTFKFDIIRKMKDNKDLITSYQIPIDFQSSFERNPTMAKTMYMCMPPGAESPYVEYLDKLYECVDKARLPLIEFEDIYINGEVSKKIKQWNVGLSDIDYIITIDLGERHDKCGLSIMHREGNRAIQDCVISWKPIHPESKKLHLISLTNVKEIIKEISKHIKIICFFDRWQSSLFVQDLALEGIKASTYTLKVGDYNTLLDFIYSKRVSLLNNEELLEEIKALERTDTGKVDHTTSSSKDMTDTLVGGVRQLFIEETYTSDKENGELIESNLLYHSGETISESKL